MLFNKTASKKSAGFSPKRSFALKDHPLYYEILQLLCMALGLFILATLFSYSPIDPSLSTWTTKVQFKNWMGRTGSIVADLLFQSIGISAFALVLILFRLARNIRTGEETVLPRAWAYGAYFVFIFSLSTLFQGIIPPQFTPWKISNPGGLVGKLQLHSFDYLTGRMGAISLAFLLTLCSAIIAFNWKFTTHAKALWILVKTFFTTQIPAWTKLQFLKLKEKSKVWFKKEPKLGISAGPLEPTMPVAIATPPALPMAAPRLQIDSEENVSEPTEGPSISTTPEEDKEIFSLVSGPTVGEPVKRKIPRRKNTGPYQLPSLNILSGRAESKSKPVDKSWYLDKANILVQKLKDFGVEGEVVHISPGPVITVYEFKPASGVKIKEIANLSDDLTLALSVLSVRIVAPIPGKPVVGIEIPSPHREMVFFKDLVQETPFFNDEIRIPIALGRLASGEPVAADLASMPHLLVAGSTGTGKSVFINTLIGSLLFRFTPQQLKLILVDPKMVELSLYEGIPHLLLPVVVDSKKAAMALRWTVDEMERRYSLMHQTGVRHIEAYNQKLPELRENNPTGEDLQPIPYIVVVIDEYADLMAVVPKDVELSIARLAQKARASGIHLVLATQRPSTDVVTGTIKANFPSRISFRVASSVDSKTILDRTGADRLLGHGDMLFHSAGFATLKRMQGSFISDSDIAKVVDTLKAQGEPEYDERILQSMEDSANLDFGAALDGEESEADGRLYDAAVRIVTEKGEASISLIQRHLRIGYNRAAMLMEQLEKEGVVSQATGTSKRRSVIAGNI